MNIRRIRQKSFGSFFAVVFFVSIFCQAVSFGEEGLMNVKGTVMGMETGL